MVKILGTNKFEVEICNKTFKIYMYNARNIRRTELAKPEHFVGKQWGVIYLGRDKKQYSDYGEMISFINQRTQGNQFGTVQALDENGIALSSKTFMSDGEMISFINRILVKSLRKNLRSQGTWRKL